MNNESKNKCNFCDREFSSKICLLRHQKTTKSCLQLQGKDKDEMVIECQKCKKRLGIQYYKQHKIKCEMYEEEIKKSKLYDQTKESFEFLKNENIELKNLVNKYDLELKEERFTSKYKYELEIKEERLNIKSLLDKCEQELKEERLNIKSLLERYEKEIKDHLNTKSLLERYESEIKEDKELITKLKVEVMEYKSYNKILKEQNDKLQSISTGVTMKLAEKPTTTININMPLTNEVLRNCATTFTIDNAYNINGLTKHLTRSLEDHITCTDPSRNIFKYLNEKEEEIVDPDLEMLLPQYLNTIKDRNNFLYKEVFEYFNKNNVPLDAQTEYSVFYNALNNIIEKNGQQSKYTEKCKQHMVRECRKQFLDKNKKKDKILVKKLTDEEMMINIIESGGNVTDYINKVFPYNEDETDEQFFYRRSMEDLFRQKKREWKEKNKC